MTLFRIHTSIGKFEKTAPDPKTAIAIIKALHPDALVKKIKKVKEYGK